MQKRAVRGQMELSFGMIFSIILIIAFLGFAFYAIKAFLGFQNDAKSARFFDEIQSDLDRIWKSSLSSETQEYLVPSYVEYVCIIDFDSSSRGHNSGFYSELKRVNYNAENIAFYPVEFTDFESMELKHVNVEETTEFENPFCINVSSNKASLILKKDFGKALITIERTE